jgi:glycosyltransferase involved in cell wall biosynthesis
MKKVLVICSSFPPTNATSTHRTLALVGHLARQGWRVLVLTMAPGADMAVDSRLMQKVPAGVQVIRAQNHDLVDCVKRMFWPGQVALSAVGTGEESPASAASPTGKEVLHRCSRREGLLDWCSSWLQFPDNRLGWFFAGTAAGLAPVRRFRPDVIYSSAPTWCCHLLAMVLRGMLRRPWVADCRDPWRANPYRRFTYRAHDAADAALERRMVRQASAVVCNTPPVQRDFCRRYGQHAHKFRTVHNGFDRDEIAAVAREGALREDGLCRFVHTGLFYGPRSPEPFLAALAIAAENDPSLRRVVRFRQVGSIRYGSMPLRELAQRHGVGDMLELTGPLDHRRTLEEVFRGDVAFAPSQGGPSGDLQVPRKFYEYYGLGKPILVSGGCCAAIREICGRQEDGLWFVEDQSPQPLAQAIESIVQCWRKGLLPQRQVSKVDLSEQRMAGDLEAILQQALLGDGRATREYVRT